VDRKRYVRIAQHEHERRRRLLAALRQASQEATERWPMVTPRNLRAVNAFFRRRLAELLGSN
jgi:hypothetical protein